MEQIYNVTIPFESIIYKSLESVTKTELPEHQKLPDGIQIDKVNDHWTAGFEVSAPSASAAKIIGIRLTEIILSLMAVFNDGFQVIPSDVSASKKEPSGPTKIEVIDGLKYVHFDVEIMFTAHATAVKHKNNFDLEVKYLASKELWPNHIRSALELNYLAVTSFSHSTKFLLLISALEGLSYGRLGSIKTIIGEVLKKAEKIMIREMINEVLIKFGIPNDECERIIENSLRTQEHGIPLHVFNYLRDIGISSVKETEVKLWWKYRSNMAHGKVIEQGKLLPELIKLTSVTQDAIRLELDT